MKNYLAIAAFVLFPALASAQALSLSQPIQCTVGKDCFIQNYVDEDSTGAYADYTCGPLSYDKHTGTDFRLLNMAAMRRGVAVLAAADGTVRAIRDGMEDVSIRGTGRGAVKDRECGNGVALHHPSGYETQYCHMRKGSIAVKQGQKVQAGQKLGLVGLSGATEFPHVHLTVRRLGRVLDPFTGLATGGKCGQKGTPLWNAQTAKALAYIPTALLSAGFAPAELTADQARDLEASPVEIPRTAPLMVLWADVMGTRKGDVLSFTMFSPNGTPIATREVPFTKDQALHFGYIGKKTNEEGIGPGEYTGRIELKREGAAEPVFTREVKVNVPY